MSTHKNIALFIILSFCLTTISCDKDDDKDNYYFPSFLKTQPNNVKQAYQAIKKNSQLTIQEKEDQLNQWATTYGVSTQYSAYLTQQANMEQRISQNTTTVISNLSMVQPQLEQIIGNKGQTEAQKQMNIEQLMRQYPVEVPTIFFIRNMEKKRGYGAIMN